MKIIDDKFRKNKLRYIIQCSVATLSIFIVLFILDTISNAVVIASLGASSFIVFALPKTRSATPKLMIGGYFAGTFSGVISHFLYRSIAGSLIKVPSNMPLAFLGAFAIGLTIFIMAITNTEHPPSAGIALGIALEGFEFVTILVILVGIVSLALIKKVFDPYLKNLF